MYHYFIFGVKGKYSSALHGSVWVKVKVKLAIKRDHEGTEREQRCSSTLSLISALDTGG
jgi:hypothetical protein